MKRLESNDFDIDISKPLKKLIDFATKELLVGRSWLINVIYWDDGDYILSLNSSWGEYKDVFEYKKSIGIYKYIKREYHKDGIGYYDNLIKTLE